MRTMLVCVWAALFGASGPAVANEPGLEGAWLIDSVIDVDGFDPSATEFVVMEDGGVAMKIGCNRMRANPEIDAPNITFGPVAGTLMMCPPPLDQVEKGFSAALEAIRSFEVDSEGKTLSLLNEAGEPFITLSRKAE